MNTNKNHIFETIANNSAYNRVVAEILGTKFLKWDLHARLFRGKNITIVEQLRLIDNANSVAMPEPRFLALVAADVPKQVLEVMHNCAPKQLRNSCIEGCPRVVRVDRSEQPGRRSNTNNQESMVEQ